MILQSVTVVTETNRSGTATLLSAAAALLVAGWLLRHNRRFWMIFGGSVLLNFAFLIVAPKLDDFGRLLDAFYSPIDWMSARFGYGIHSLGTVFFLFVAFPFVCALAIAGAIAACAYARTGRPPLPRSDRVG